MSLPTDFLKRDHAATLRALDSSSQVVLATANNHIPEGPTLAIELADKHPSSESQEGPPDLLQ